MDSVTDDQNSLPNGAHELLARLYREIGVAAVARALAEPIDIETEELHYRQPAKPSPARAA